MIPYLLAAECSWIKITLAWGGLVFTNSLIHFSPLMLVPTLDDCQDFLEPDEGGHHSLKRTKTLLKIREHWSRGWFSIVASLGPCNWAKLSRSLFRWKSSSLMYGVIGHGCLKKLSFHLHGNHPLGSIFCKISRTKLVSYWYRTVIS